LTVIASAAKQFPDFNRDEYALEIASARTPGEDTFLLP